MHLYVLVCTLYLCHQLPAIVIMATLAARQNIYWPHWLPDKTFNGRIGRQTKHLLATLAAILRQLFFLALFIDVSVVSNIGVISVAGLARFIIRDTISVDNMIEWRY